MRNSGAAMRKVHGLAAAEKQVQEGCTPPLHAGVRYAAGRRGGEGILSRGGEFVGAWVKLLQTRAGGGDGGERVSRSVLAPYRRPAANQRQAMP